MGNVAWVGEPGEGLIVATVTNVEVVRKLAQGAAMELVLCFLVLVLW